MSRRLLLSASSATSIAVPDPLPGDGGETDPLWPGWSATSDPVLMAIRPHGRLAARSTVTPASDLNAAATAVKNAAKALGSAGSLSWDGDGPEYRYDLMFTPGTYVGPMGGGEWGCYVGTSGDPADTALEADGGSNGTLHSFGSQYLEGLTLRAYSSDGDTAPKYPWHITGGPVTVAANCVFDAYDTVVGQSQSGGNRGGSAVGKDASVITLFYRCKFRLDPTKGDFGFNMHGAPLPTEYPETMVFLDCETEGVTTISGTGNRDVNGNPSRLFIINLTHDEHLVKITTDVNTEVYTDSDLPVTGNPPAIYRNVTTWPQLTDGLPDILSDYYYPSALGDEPTTQTIPVTDAAPMAPVPGRVYITRVRTEQAMRVTTSGVTVTAAAGQVMTRHQPSDTPYVRDEGPEMGLLTPNVTTTVGQNTWLHSYYYTRYPGDNGFWVRCAFDNAAVRVTGSAQLGGLTDCYYTDDGTTLVPVNTGTAHPLPFIRAT